MKLAVIGSRGFNNYPLMEWHLSKYNPTHIVSGGAQGADKLAGLYAVRHGIEACGIRYITFEVDGGPKIFGYNDIDKSHTVSVLEGPFDSTFVYNAVANAGAADHSNTDFLIRQGCDLRFIFDRDYETNYQVRKQLDERISQGYKVVIYDKNFQYKDINDAIIVDVS